MVGPGKVNAPDDVHDSGAADEQGRVAVDHPVEDLPSRVVPRVT
jgi:hypothetical protein